MATLENRFDHNSVWNKSIVCLVLVRNSINSTCNISTKAETYQWESFCKVMEDEKRSKSRSDGELCAIDTVCNDNEQSNGCTTIYIYAQIVTKRI